MNCASSWLFTRDIQYFINIVTIQYGNGIAFKTFGCHSKKDSQEQLDLKIFYYHLSNF
jgi:hypothetical protein